MKEILMMFMVVLIMGTLTSCNAEEKKNIILPAAEKIVEVAVINGDASKSASKDAAYISKLIQKMSQATDTGIQSVNDDPNGDTELRIELKKNNGETETVFMYYRNGDLLLEKPYQGIYKADPSLYAIVNQCK